MNTHNFKIVGGDTDSIMFCKPDMSPFNKQEQDALLSEINSLLPTEIKFANDGIFSKVLYLKTKNYVMIDEKGKRKIKGSSLKSATLEPILKNLLNEFIEELIAEQRLDVLQTIYNKYIEMANNITDIRPWCTKKTLSPTTYRSERKNETDIIDAIKGTEYRSGDKVYLYPVSKIVETGEFYKVGANKGNPKTKTVRSWQLLEKFDGNYDKDTYLSKIKKTTDRFSTVIDTSIFD